MATLAIAAGGAILGGAIGWGVGATMAGIALGWTIGAYIGRSINAPEGLEREVEGPRLEDLSVQSSAYGKALPRIYGTVRTAGNIIWSAGIEEHKQEEEVSSGGGKGGGGGGSTTKTTYSYTSSFAIGLCEGVIIGINRIWMDGKLFTESGKSSFFSQFSGANKVSSLSIYTGSEDQEPDPVIESHEGEGNVPGYRGLAYIVFEDLKLEDYGHRIPNIEVEIAVGMQQKDFTFEVPDGTENMTVFDNGYIACGAPNAQDPDSAWLRIINTEGVIIYEQKTTADSDYLVSFRCSPQLNDMLSEPMTLYMENQDDDYYIIDAITGEVKYHEQNFWNYHVFYNPNAADIGYLSEWNSYVWVIASNPSGYEDDKIGICNWGLVGKPGPAIDTVHCTSSCWVRILNDKIYLAFGSVLYEYNSWYDIPDDPDEDPGDYNRKSDVSDTSGGNFVAATPNGDFISKSGNTCYVHVGMGPEIQQIYEYTSGGVEPVSLKAIVSEELKIAGLEDLDFDLSSMSDEDVVGFAVTEPMSASKSLKPLMRAFHFDLIESDWKIYGTTRGQSVKRRIPEEDLAVHEQNADVPAKLVESRSEEKELPTEIVVQYQDKDLDYQVGSQSSWRSCPNHENKKNIRLPLVMSATQAKRVADKMMKISWVERTSFQLKTLAKHFDLLPSDVIEVEGKRILFNELTYKMPGIVEAVGVAESNTAYQSEASAEAASVPEQQVNLYPPTFSVFLDLPSLKDENLYQANFWIAAFAVDKGWTGAVVYRSLDGGVTWNSIAQISNMATVLKCNEALQSGPTTRWDRGNSLNLRMLSYDKTLESVTEREALAGSNTLALRNSNGKIEIISFTDVAQEDDGTYTISNLIRGRKGTEHNTDIHNVSEYAVLLKENLLEPIPVSDESIDSSIEYMIVTSGVPRSEGNEKGFTCNAVNLKPYSPVYVRGDRNSSDDLVITWLRRVRGTAGWLASDVRLKEEKEEYEVDILDSDGNVIRTLSISGEDSDQDGVTYTASQQEEDFGSVQSSVSVVVYQLSSTVGRGYGRPATV